MESPFQLIQALEVASCAEKYLLIIRLNDLERNNIQLKKMVSLFSLKNVIYLNARYKSALLFYAVPFLLMTMVAKKCFVGDENSIIFRLLKRLILNKKVWLLDDGVATLNSKEDSSYRRLTIFKTVEGDYNNLSECRDLIQSRPLFREANIIVGSKLVEEGICTKEVYYSILEAMAKDIGLQNSEIIYVPHRGEAESNLVQIADKFNFELVRNSLPIELIAIEFDVHPVRVVSVLSTALYSMSLIYDNAEFRVYPLSYDSIDSRREGIESLYCDMRKNTTFFNYMG